MGLLDRLKQLAHLGFHVSDLARWAVEQVIGVKASGRGRLQSAQVDLRPEAGMHGVAAAHPDRRAGVRELFHLGELLPHHARDRAGAVAELQAQVVAAVAPLAAL